MYFFIFKNPKAGHLLQNAEVRQTDLEAQPRKIFKTFDIQGLIPLNGKGVRRVGKTRFKFFRKTNVRPLKRGTHNFKNDLFIQLFFS